MYDYMEEVHGDYRVELYELEGYYTFKLYATKREALASLRRHMKGRWTREVRVYRRNVNKVAIYAKANNVWTRKTEEQDTSKVIFDLDGLSV